MVDDPDDSNGAKPPEIKDTPTVSCSRCDREWSLGFELDELQVGNQAVEQFALDHMRHTGHFPDDVQPWVTDCCQCPDGDEFLAEQSARRWAETHTRHTRHTVEISHADDDAAIVGPD